MPEADGLGSWVEKAKGRRSTISSYKTVTGRQSTAQGMQSAFLERLRAAPGGCQSHRRHPFVNI